MHNIQAPSDLLLLYRHGLLTVRAVAHHLRARAGQLRSPYSTRAIVSAAFPDALVTGVRLPEGLDEAASRTPQGIVIVYRRGASTAEQRFGISRAFADLFFDAGTGRDRAASTVGDAWPVEELATELLAPRDVLAEHVRRFPSPDPDEHHVYLDEVDHLASRFHVPARVIEEQIRELPRRTN